MFFTGECCSCAAASAIAASAFSAAASPVTVTPPRPSGVAPATRTTVASTKSPCARFGHKVWALEMIRTPSSFWKSAVLSLLIYCPMFFTTFMVSALLRP